VTFLIATAFCDNVEHIHLSALIASQMHFNQYQIIHKKEHDIIVIARVYSNLRAQASAAIVSDPDQEDPKVPFPQDLGTVSVLAVEAVDLQFLPVLLIGVQKWPHGREAMMDPESDQVHFHRTRRS
jgi:hypothetical protein